MFTDLRSIACSIAFSLFMLVILQWGCQRRMDRFHERREEKHQYRDEQREDRQDGRRRGKRHSQDGDVDSGSVIGSDDAAATDL